MNVTLEIPNDCLVINKEDLKTILREMVEEIQAHAQNGEIMTIQETASYLKVSIPTVRKLIGSNEIPYFQRGQVIRLNKLHVIRWLEDKTSQERFER